MASIYERGSLGRFGREGEEDRCVWERGGVYTELGNRATSACALRGAPRDCETGSMTLRGGGSYKIIQHWSMIARLMGTYLRYNVSRCILQCVTSQTTAAAAAAGVDIDISDRGSCDLIAVFS